MFLQKAPCSLLVSIHSEECYIMWLNPRITWKLYSSSRKPNAGRSPSEGLPVPISVKSISLQCEGIGNILSLLCCNSFQRIFKKHILFSTQENTLFNRAFARQKTMWHPWVCECFHKAWTPVASSVLVFGEDSVLTWSRQKLPFLC